MKEGLIFFLLVLVMILPGMAYASGSYVAGDLTKTAISDSLEQGKQIHYQISLKGKNTDNSTEWQKAFDDILSRISIDGTVYQNDGQMVSHLSVMAEDIRVLDILAVQMLDGYVLFSTNYTDDIIFAIPVLSTSDEVNLLGIVSSNSGIPSTDPEFHNLPAGERLKITTSETVLLIAQTVLGWVSGSQIESEGEFYTFDFDYLEPTETRSGVAQRMIGKVSPAQFCALLWDVATTLDWQGGEFQRALADVLAEQGVTRLQVRSVIDAIFPDVEIDPAKDFVEPTHIISDKNALCQYNDISYFFKKFSKFSDRIWEDSLEDKDLELIVSYDDYGDMVGLDALLPKITEYLPYEGTFTYSTFTDDDWQVLTTSHGELQVDDKSRIIGDYRHLNGEDIDGHNENTFDADLILENKTDNTVSGFGISGKWTYDTNQSHDGIYVENTDGKGSVVIHYNNDDINLFSMQMEGLMKTTGTDFEFNSKIDVSLLNNVNVSFSADMKQEDVKILTLPENTPIDLTDADEACIEEIKKKIQTNATSVFMEIMRNAKIINDIGILTKGNDL